MRKIIQFILGCIAAPFGFLFGGLIWVFLLGAGPMCLLCIIFDWVVIHPLSKMKLIRPASDNHKDYINECWFIQKVPVEMAKMAFQIFYFNDDEFSN